MRARLVLTLIGMHTGIISELPVRSTHLRYSVARKVPARISADHTFRCRTQSFNLINDLGGRNNFCPGHASFLGLPPYVSVA
jgi:hypothetical protein